MPAHPHQDHAHRVHELRPWIPRRDPHTLTIHELAAGLEVTDEDAEGPHGPVPVRRYRLLDHLRRVPPLVWAHGGGFVAGDLDMPESHAVACAIARTGREVIAVGYRLVPLAHPWLLVGDRPLPGVRFPVPMDDVTAALEYVLAGAVDGRVVLGGASAGACLSTTSTLRSIRTGRPSAERLVLAYGLFHSRLPPRSDEVRARTRGRLVFTPAMVYRAGHNYAGSLANLNEPLAFPGGHDVSGLPPALFVDADHDSLRASAEAFAAELRGAGVPARRYVVAQSVHAFLNRPATAAFAMGIHAMTSWLDATD